MMNFVHELQVYDNVEKNIINSRACCWASYKRCLKVQRNFSSRNCQELSKRAEQELNIYTVETDFVVFTSSAEMIGERSFWGQRPWKYFN